MFKYLYAASLSLLTLASISGPVFAVPSVSPQSEYAQAETKPRPQRDRKNFFEQLNLTEAQKQQISTIRQKYRPNIEQTAQRLRTTQQDLQKLMASSASRDQILAKYQQVGNLRQDMDRLRFESMLDIRDVLTTAQRQELEQMMQQRRSKRPEPRNARPEPPAPL
ncbi:Spy/CpxP family protein refolding chaperone [Chroococcus sp. FPU101]|uniref:Spy/CpxP family protein refolding chaperone n=1 Tax=Chroococcus sp. FPU101 TaxID=1974212 RepID=UPI001A90484D|nr:Spy/CpxP family protein refolding chaperone [Chroococcus sp. FPU101]GFE70406.1 hypothetical protein CFPU101_30160 [Chroococcus sp. FPU101]